MENTTFAHEFEGYLPLLPHEIDDKLLIYTVYKNQGPDLVKYPFLMRRFVIDKEPLIDKSFEIKFSDLATFHLDMTGQGFTPISRSHGDDPNVIGSYI